MGSFKHSLNCSNECLHRSLRSIAIVCVPFGGPLAKHGSRCAVVTLSVLESEVTHAWLRCLLSRLPRKDNCNDMSLSHCTSSGHWHDDRRQILNAPSINLHIFD